MENTKNNKKKKYRKKVEKWDLFLTRYYLPVN